MNSKLRVWHIPQVPGKSFYIPVKDIIEAKKVMDILAAYDIFQLENHIKPDFCNMNGVQKWCEEENEWIDWYLETEDDCFENVEEYCKQCDKHEELEEFANSLFSQLKG